MTRRLITARLAEAADLIAHETLRSICPTCLGSGEIKFNDSPNHDPRLDDSAPCGSCYGAGTRAA